MTLRERSKQPSSAGPVRRVVYGCTELLNAEAFLALLSPLAAA